ncbi:carbohydrate ABC transporter permease [Alicyclobacillus acidiphilus]|uniref:carbohydrate ABC transporter permease n=1 Tax=Alicyclobacillus acidiphilus TaxID=182455 RepID=UPI0012EE9A86|nr:carbohydrate ABC transporter permease [Alicyclobacillus acidiphilus]
MYKQIPLSLNYIVLIIIALAYIVPFLWLLSNSLKTDQELFSTPITWIPKHFAFSNFKDAFTQFPFFEYLRNTLIIVGCNLIGVAVSNTLVAYGFSRIQWKGRNVIFIFVLATMMLPFQVTMIPLFVLFTNFGWIGTFLPLIVPTFFGNAYYIFLLRQFFIGIPKDLSESAKVDGANEFYIFSRIILPLSKPVIATVLIFSFIHDWGDFIGPLVYLSNNKLYTLSLGVQQIMGATDPQWPLLMAAGVAMTVPVLVIFFFMQKQFIQGISFTGIKD